MATEELTPSPAPDAPPIAPTPAAVPDKAPAPRLLDDANLTEPPAEDAPAPSWRERYAGGNAKELKRLERFVAEEDFFKAFRDTENKLRSGKSVPELPEGATDAEIAAHRKALGIPDKPDGYGLAFPDGVQVTEAHTALLSKVQEQALARNVRPADAKAMFDIYTQLEAETQTAQAEAVAEAKLQNIAELRGEWKGSDYKRNIGILRDFFAKGFEGHEKALDLLANATLPGGLRVGDSAEILRGMAAFARMHADEEALIGGDGGGGGKSLEDEKDALLDKSAAGKLTKAEDARLNQIYEAITAKQARAGRGSARP